MLYVFFKFICEWKYHRIRDIIKTCLAIKDLLKPEWWVLENPVGRLPTLVPELGKAKMWFHPCDYGDAYTKKTALWGRFNMPIKNFVEPEFVEFVSKKGEKKRMSKIHWEAFRLPIQERMQVRSITPQGFAKAFYEANK